MRLRKKVFFFNVRKKVPMATKPREGVGAKGLSGRTLRKELFAASLRGKINKLGQIL